MFRSSADLRRQKYHKMIRGILVPIKKSVYTAIYYPVNYIKLLLIFSK